MKKVNLKYCLIALAGMGVSANASAALTCSDIVFSPEAFAAYEYIDKACIEMVDRDGIVYAKLTARVVAQTASGTHIRYRHADGELGASHKSNAPEAFQSMINGKPVEMKDLAVRQNINIYVSDSYWVDPAMIEEAIVEEIIAEEIVEEVIEEEIIEEEIIEAELPTTAGPLPWLALFGSMFLLLGGALRFSRKQ